MRDAISGIGLVVFGTIAVLALCIGVCALADAVTKSGTMLGRGAVEDTVTDSPAGIGFGDV